MFMYIHIYFIIEQNFKTEWKQTNQPCVVPHVYVCMIKFHVYACSYVFGHVVYVCIHIWRQVDIRYLPHSFSPSLLRQD